ncbi:MAG: enoyl-CoA hydratase/isomerase family protein [Myxococcales bacterium]|nr:enoyl-CoA hydratase/isomerase family protein [Myxococcales bacterium]
MADYTGLTDLLVEQEGAILRVTLNREDARNAYSNEMIDSLMRVFDLAECDDSVRCLVLSGAGRAFSAGGDLKQMREHSGMFEGDAVRLRSQYLRGIHQVPRRLLRFDKPVIAALNGAAIGAGLDLACMCDVRVAVEGAKFGSTFVKLGLIPGDGGAYVLSRTVGFPRALEMILTGRLVDAQEALQMGLVHEVVPSDRLLERSMERAEQLCSLAPLALRLAKAACYQSWDLTAEQALTLAASYQGIAQNTADHDEGVDALLEKREANFQGR